MVTFLRKWGLESTLYCVTFGTDYLGTLVAAEVLIATRTVLGHFRSMIALTLSPKLGNLRPFAECGSTLPLSLATHHDLSDCYL